MNATPACSQSDTCEVTRQQIIVTLHKDAPWHPDLRQMITDCSSTPDSDFKANEARLDNRRGIYSIELTIS